MGIAKDPVLFSVQKCRDVIFKLVLMKMIMTVYLLKHFRILPKFTVDAKCNLISSAWDVPHINYLAVLKPF